MSNSQEGEKQTPARIARKILYRLMTDRELKEFVKAVASSDVDRVRKALREPMQNAVNIMDDVVWNIETHQAVQKELASLLLRKIAEKQ